MNKKSKKNLKKAFGIFGAATAVSAATLAVVAAKKLPNSRYANKPEEKNPYEGIKVKFSYDNDALMNADGVKGRLEPIGKLTYKSSFYDKFVKRALDILVSASGLIVLAPVFAGIAIAIQIDDPGTILFCQKRVGKNKQYFKLHKFRSMKTKTPKNVPTHMMQNPDEYITRVGKFLRAHSLDELPQIWDIFIGNMSVVGPRPALWNQDLLIAERDKYDVSKVRPGLTGWAQINGRDELSIEEKSKFDGEYVAKQNILMDAKCFIGSAGKVANDKAVVEGGTGTIGAACKPSTSDKTTRYPFNKLGYASNLNTDEIIGHIGFDEPVKPDMHKKRCVLITGTNSYIGESFKKYAEKKYPLNFKIDMISVQDDEWKKRSFSKYDIVLHVAGIAHRRSTKDIEYEENLYYSVNTKLALSVAKKAKRDGVSYFFFMSSLSVYGQADDYNEKIVITKSTVPKPTTLYGKSKLCAEVNLFKLSDEAFKVVCFRPPMVYGYKCKGNFSKLLTYVKISHILPVIRNKRSMIYIDNLSELFSQIMICNIPNSCVLLPQNCDYVCTTDMLKSIYKTKKSWYISISVSLALKLTLLVKTPLTELVSKIFGSFVVEHSVSNIPNISYQLVLNNESFKRSVIG